VTKRSSEIRRAFAACSPAFIATAVFSFFLNLLMLTVVAGFMLLILGLLEAVRARVLVRTGVKFEGLLKDRVFAAVFERSVGAPGATRAQALQDLDVLRQFLTGSGLFALLDAPWAPIFIAVIFLLHPWLGMAALAGAVVLLTLALLNEALTGRPLKLASERAIKANNFAEASLNNAEVLKAMGMLGGIRRRWYQHRMAAVRQQARASDRAGLVVASTKFVRLYIQVLLLGVGAYLAMQQRITPGAMIAAAILLGRALAPVELAVGNWRGFVAARAALARLRELLDTVPVEKPGMRLPRPEGRVQFEHVIAAAPGGDPASPILKGVNFQLAPGGALGVIGPTAAGKSTLARLLVGIWRATRGTVRLDGADVYEWNRADLGNHIGYQPQEVKLFDGTVAENIARFGKVDADAVVTAARKAAAHEFILRLPRGYDTLIGANGHTLSGGQRQRIGLARALYGDPSLIVLDEPNTNLDQPGERALLATMAELRRAGRTLVIIAHRPNILVSVDRILCLNEGVMEMLGPREEVIARYTLPPPDLAATGRIVSIVDKRRLA
jgi:PrtD family type I secretion system ABC transporter